MILPHKALFKNSFLNFLYFETISSHKALFKYSFLSFCILFYLSKHTLICSYTSCCFDQGSNQKGKRGNYPLKKGKSFVRAEFLGASEE